jgi:zinc transporter ZupT
MLGLIQSLYATHKENQTFLNARFGLAEDVLEPYKKIIDRWLWPDVFCPACAVNDLEQANPQLAKTAMMLMVALGLHCTMDGLGIAFGDNLLGHPDVALVAGISVHKIPEGLALILLLLGAGIERKKAISWALGVESMTMVGGVIGFYLVNSTSTFWLGILFAHVAGGFFYMITSAIRGVLGQHTEEPRYAQHALVSGLSFVSSAVLLGLVAKPGRPSGSIEGAIDWVCATLAA